MTIFLILSIIFLIVTPFYFAWQQERANNYQNMLKTRVEKTEYLSDGENVIRAANGYRVFIETACGNTYSLVGIFNGGEPSQEAINRIWETEEHRKKFVLEAVIIEETKNEQDAKN